MEQQVVVYNLAKGFKYRDETASGHSCTRTGKNANCIQKEIAILAKDGWFVHSMVAYNSNTAATTGSQLADPYGGSSAYAYMGNEPEIIVVFRKK